MTEPAPGPAPLGTEAETPEPRRRWRPPAVDWRAKARWFGAEYLIVVLGVLTAVGINAWWGDRQDRARERVLLAQLASDLAETERRMDLRDARVDEGVSYGLGRLLAEYGAPSEPPADTVLAWLQRGTYIPSPRPVLGTAEGLVASGDLTVIADDSLRVAVTAYLDATREHQADHAIALRLAIEHSEALWGRVDRREASAARLAALPDSAEAAVRARSTFAFLPKPGWQTPFPLDPDAFFRDRTAYTALSGLARMHAALAEDRDGMRSEARALRQRVDSYLAR